MVAFFLGDNNLAGPDCEPLPDLWWSATAAYWAYLYSKLAMLQIGAGSLLLLLLLLLLLVLVLVLVLLLVFFWFFWFFFCLLRLCVYDFTNGFPRQTPGF